MVSSKMEKTLENKDELENYVVPEHRTPDGGIANTISENYQHDTGVSASLELVSSQDFDMDIELEDFNESSDSEYTSYDDDVGENEQTIEDGRDLVSSNNNAIPLDKINDLNKDATLNDARSGALVPVDADDDDDDISSEEERDLMKEIREEIENKVRKEMKDELEVYKEKLEAIEQGTIPNSDSNANRDRHGEEGLENMEPKLREAYIKMRKLDRILAKRVKKEKAVKKERILLERRIRNEIANLKSEGREQREIKVNTEKFVALALPPSHNEGVEVVPHPVTPVFQTQLNENDFQDRNGTASKMTENGGLRCSSADSTLTGASSSTNTDGKMSGKNEKKSRRKKKKDFIKRNKELAAYADDTLAMTEEEKKRVGELLTDLDFLPDLPEKCGGVLKGEANPFQVSAMHSGEGYIPDDREMMSLANIDCRLKDILPEEEYSSLVSVPVSVTQQHKLFMCVDVRNIIDCEHYGEKVLLETKEQRDMQARLQRIEEELSKFHNPEEIELVTPQLDGDQLKDLLDQCVRSLSRSSMADTTSVAESTPRSSQSSVMENPPKLPDDVLQKLLAEAHFPLSARLSALTEEDESIYGQDEPISAETWRAIVEEDIYQTNVARDLDIESLSRTSSCGALRSSMNTDKYNHNMDPQRYGDFQNGDTSKVGDKRLILPEINQSPFLVSQGLNNQLPKNEAYYRRNREQSSSVSSSLQFVRNDLVEENKEYGDNTTCSDQEVTVIPRPPSGEKRPMTIQSSNSSRVTTPVSRIAS